MLGICLANDADATFAPDDLAGIAHALDAGANLHAKLLGTPDVTPPESRCGNETGGKDRPGMRESHAAGRKMQTTDGERIDTKEVTGTPDRFMLGAECDASFGEVVGADFDGDAIAGEDADVVHAHLATDVGQDFGLLVIGEPHLEHGVGERLGHDGFERQLVILLGHSSFGESFGKI